MLTKATGKVYAIQYTPHDLASAQDFGQLEYLLKTSLDQTFAPQEVLSSFREKLEGFTDNDYLLLVGDPVAMALAVNVAAEANSGRAKVLKWSKKYKRYYPIEIDFYTNPTL
ncbi:MAG: hypothetical protein AB7U43_12980 [Desulfobacter sp.]